MSNILSFPKTVSYVNKISFHQKAEIIYLKEPTKLTSSKSYSSRDILSFPAKNSKDEDKHKWENKIRQELENDDSNGENLLDNFLVI